jgi:hypothetical protein
MNYEEKEKRGKENVVPSVYKYDKSYWMTGLDKSEMKGLPEM